MQTSLPFNVNYIVYEKGIQPFFRRIYQAKEEKYYTTIPIEILRLSRLIEKSEGAEIIVYLEEVYSSNDPVVEISPNKHLKRTINLIRMIWIN